MSDPKELAELFGAAADGVESILPWKQRPPPGLTGTWTSQSYMRSDYAQQEGMAAAFRGIEAMYRKLAEGSRPISEGKP